MAKLGTLAKSEDLQLSFHAAPNMVTIGIDLGDHDGHCCLLGSDGVVLTEGRVRSTPEAMASQRARGGSVSYSRNGVMK